MAQFCTTACATDPLTWGDSCGLNSRQAGIPYLVFLSCDISPTDTDIADPAWWCTQIAADKVGISPRLLGEKPESSFTEEDEDSCSPQIVQGATQTINFTSTDMDTTSTGLRSTWYKDITFWNFYTANFRKFQLGYIDCAGLFYGFINPFTLKASMTIGNKNTMKQKWTGNVSWISLYQDVPFNVTGLVSLLYGGCP